MPTVSPFMTAKVTSSTARTVLRGLNSPPRTGKCLVSPLTCNSGCAAPPRSATGSNMSMEVIVSIIPSTLVSPLPTGERSARSAG